MKILVVIDAQNDFIHGVLGSEYAKSIVPNIVKKIQVFEGIIITTYDTHLEDYLQTREGKHLAVPHCIYMSDGWQYDPDIHRAIKQKVRDGHPMDSFNKGGFGTSAIPEYLAFTRVLLGLKNDTIEEVIFIGYDTDICVISNVLTTQAYDPELNITVDASCCAGSSAAKHRAALEVMRSCQINVINEA